MKNGFRILAAAAAMSAGMASAQTYTIYTDRAAFTAAGGALATETFNSVVADQQFRTQPVTVGDVTIAASGAGQPSTRNIIDAAPFIATGTPSVDGSTDLALTISTNPSSVAFSFANPVYSFGADYYGINDTNASTTIQIAGQSFIPPANGGVNANSFYGIISSSAFSTVNFVSGGNLDNFQMDNISYSTTAPATPEPAIWGLMLLGFGAGGAALRQRRRLMPQTN